MRAPVHDAHAFYHCFGLLYHEIKIKFIDLLILVHCAEIVGHCAERYLGYARVEQCLPFAKVKKVVSAKRYRSHTGPALKRFEVYLVHLFITGIDGFKIDIVGFLINSVHILPLGAAKMFDSDSAHGFQVLPLTVPKLSVILEPTHGCLRRALALKNG